MRTLYWFCVLAAILFSSATAQTQGRFGAGIMFGEPTGAAWKYNLSQQNTLAGGVGISPSNEFRAHVDYLWYSAPFSEPRLRVHYGPGAALGEDMFGIRGDVGLTYLIQDSPIDIFLEIAPTLDLANGGELRLMGGFGGRYLFN